VQKRKFVFFSSCRKVNDDIRTEIDTDRESQDLKDSVYCRYRDAVLFEHSARPQKQHFSSELERIGNQEVSLHFSGHGGESGLYWHGALKNKEKQIRGKELARLVQLHSGAVEKIDCFFLNACCTLSTGLELHKIGVRVVVCWQTTVRDSTARDFARRFYDKVDLSVREPGQHATAFEMVCVEMSDVLSNDWPCLLQTGSGREESVQIWNGTELVTITHELLHSLVPVEPKPTSTLKKKPKKKPNNVTLGSNSLVPVEPKPTFILEKKPKKKLNNVTLGSTLKERVLLKCFCLKVTGRVTFKQEHFKGGGGEEEEEAAAEKEEEEEEDILGLISEGEASDSDDDEKEE
jgi:hypothetical protein